MFADSEDPEKADLGLRCPHMSEVTFSHGTVHLPFSNCSTEDR